MPRLGYEEPPTPLAFSFWATSASVSVSIIAEMRRLWEEAQFEFTLNESMPSLNNMNEQKLRSHFNVNFKSPSMKQILLWSTLSCLGNLKPFLCQLMARIDWHRSPGQRQYCGHEAKCQRSLNLCNKMGQNVRQYKIISCAFICFCLIMKTSKKVFCGLPNKRKIWALHVRYTRKKPPRPRMLSSAIQVIQLSASDKTGRAWASLMQPSFTTRSLAWAGHFSLSCHKILKIVPYNIKAPNRQRRIPAVYERALEKGVTYAAIAGLLIWNSLLQMQANTQAEAQDKILKATDMLTAQLRLFTEMNNSNFYQESVARGAAALWPWSRMCT